MNSDKSVFRFDTSLQNILWTIDGEGKRVFTQGAQVLTPSYSSTAEPKFAVDVVAFGDGYEQVTESGIQSVRQVFHVGYLKQRREVAAALKRFFEGEPEGSIYNRRPSEWFWWIPPESFTRLVAPLPIKVRCDSFKIEALSYNSYSIQATYTQSFEP